MRRFSFHRRNGIVYCQLFNAAAGRYSSAKSTGTKDPDEALLVAAGWLQNGVPSGRGHKPRPVVEAFTLDAMLAAMRADTFGRDDAARVLVVLKDRGFIDHSTLKGGPSAELVVDFLRRSWTENGPYVLERRAYGHSLTKRHIRESSAIIERYWAEPFAGVRLGDLKRNDIKAALVRLSESGLSAGTVNKAFGSLSAPLGWAFRNDIIAEDPSEGVPRFSALGTKKGILEDEELAALLKMEWTDARAKTAFMVAATTGMRRGEVTALQARDIGEDRLFVRHSWNDDDRLKSPKNGEERESALLPEVRRALLDLLATNPHGASGEAFVFYGAYPDRPLDGQVVSRAFDEALVRFSLGEKYEAAKDEEKDKARAAWKARGLSFHSLRHGYAKRMADRLDVEQAMKATGHLSRAMLEHYADHKTKEDFAAVAAASADAFGTVLAFRKGA